MPVLWDPATRELHLRNGLISYVLRVLEDGTLGGAYVGGPLGEGSVAHAAPRFAGFANRLGDAVALEYPTPGIGDFRAPALVIEQPDGSTALKPAYVGHRIVAGKPQLDGLPSTYVEAAAEADTLEVDLRDEPSGVDVALRYTIFGGRAAIARSAVIRNGGERAITIRCAMSASLDLPDSEWELVRLSGSWARERHVVRTRLASGTQGVGSVRGASSHQHNPFLALVRPWATEAQGEALAVSLVYSGNFLAEAEVDQYATTRVRIGIHHDEFAWRLEPGASFQVPEAVVAWSESGLGGISDVLHPLYRERLARGAWRDRPRPVLINNWEATYFDFDEDKLVSIASTSRDLGIELFVLDDGWFGRRDDDTTSLGDWTVDRRKLPNGLDSLARRVEGLGMRFGLWIEPEMVSERSRLFEDHPDWAIGVPGRPRTEHRQQLVLDLGRPEVVDHLERVLSEILSSAPISYVKWDMNRNITEPWWGGLPADRQGEGFHRYIVGVYELYRRLTAAFPEILFESCAGGGGRFDPGLLAFAPQGWTSDDTDAIERLAIQWGTSIPYPLSSMGAHVSAVPNHQIGRVTPIGTRAAVAFFGVFGYELDPTRLDDEERRLIAEQVAFYRTWRETFQRGRFLRLRSPFEGDRNETAWMVVEPDRAAAVVGWYRVLARASTGPSRLRVRGLEPDASYRVSVWPPSDDPVARANELVRRGDDLMRIGLFLDIAPRVPATPGDFGSRVFVLERT
ncbi:MAG TPA: alpha-galactosidase [Candidatus Dormibacteraeota bacterium]|nr:alpha-galactosidase [Candidatus Dormibacteraeota bacterium]